MCSTSRITSPGWLGCLSTWKLTLRPTIMADSCSMVVFLVSTVPMYLPLRSTLQRSATAMISASLWEMNRMLLPSAARFFMICISSCRR